MLRHINDSTTSSLLSYFKFGVDTWSKTKDENKKRSFCMHVLDSINMVFDAIMNFNKEQTEKLLTKLTTTGGKMQWSRTSSRTRRRR